jgi:hypothetical protein
VTTFYYLQHMDAPDLAVGVGPDSPERDFHVVAGDTSGAWVAPVLDLSPGRIVDYLPTNQPLRVFSGRLRDAIESVIGPTTVTWLPVSIRQTDGATTGWWALWLPGSLDEIDRGASTLVDDHVVKAVLDRAKIHGKDLIAFPMSPHRLVVSEAIRTAVERAACTGIEFARVPMV